MNQIPIIKNNRSPQEIITLIRLFFDRMQIRLTEYQSHENLLDSYAVHLLPVHSSSTGFSGTGQTAAAARAGAYLKCVCDLCTQPDLPFYSLRTKTISYCNNPSEIATCAGSSPAEALVQGISELFSRKAAACRQELSAAPEMPDSVLNDYPDVRRMYRLLKEQYGDSTRLYDISGSGIQFTAALRLSDPQSGESDFTYSMHPDPSTAISRLLINAIHGSHFAHALYYSGYSRKDDPQRLIQALLRQGYDLRISDCSCAGMYVYQIMIPELTAFLQKTPQVKPITHTLAFHAAVQRCREFRSAHPLNPAESLADLAALRPEEGSGFVPKKIC